MQDFDHQQYFVEVWGLEVFMPESLAHPKP